MPLEREISEVDWDAATAEKGGYETFMLKEIHEQADAVADTIGERAADDHTIDLGDLGAIDDELLRRIERIVIVACGTSYHAGLAGRYAIEEWARVPVEVEIASEYRYRKPVVGTADLVIGVSQSGETADTLAAMRTAKQRWRKVLAICNVMGSQMTRDADGVLYTRAGIEIGVAATKTFVTQVVAFQLLALRLAELRGALGRTMTLTELIREVKQLPHLISATLDGRHRADRADRRRRQRARVLHVPGTQRRAADRAGGGAQAQGDLLRRDRRLRRRRDEARPDRAAGRDHAGRGGRDRLAGAREADLEHPGGARPRRARDRHRDRGQHRDRAALRRGDPRAAGRTGC